MEEDLISSLSLKLQILTAQFNILNNWISAKFGVELINKESKYYKQLAADPMLESNNELQQEIMKDLSTRPPLAVVQLQQRITNHINTNKQQQPSEQQQLPKVILLLKSPAPTSGGAVEASQLPPQHNNNKGIHFNQVVKEKPITIDLYAAKTSNTAASSNSSSRSNVVGASTNVLKNEEEAEEEVVCLADPLLLLEPNNDGFSSLIQQQQQQQQEQPNHDQESASTMSNPTTTTTTTQRRRRATRPKSYNEALSNYKQPPLVNVKSSTNNNSGVWTTSQLLGNAPAPANRPIARNFTTSCPVCNDQFSSTKSLESHLKTHFGVKTFPCTSCHKSYYDQGTLNRHLKTHEANAPKFNCNICALSFLEKWRLGRHLRIVHEIGLKENDDIEPIIQTSPQEDEEEAMVLGIEDSAEDDNEEQEQELNCTSEDPLSGGTRTHAIQSNTASDDDDLDVKPMLC